jgi:GNAT superfamily N-acetyltransferase
MYLSGAVFAEAIGKGLIDIAEEDGEIVGYLWFKNLIRKDFGKIEEICSIKKGLGSKFMELAEDFCTHKKIKLDVVDFNENAISFYKNRGYKEIGRKGEKVINIIMQKTIKDESPNV